MGNSNGAGMACGGGDLPGAVVGGAWSQDPVGQRLIHAADFSEGC